MALKGFSRKTEAYGWTPIEPARNKRFYLYISNLMLDRGGPSWTPIHILSNVDRLVLVGLYRLAPTVLPEDRQTGDGDLLASCWFPGEIRQLIRPHYIRKQTRQ